MNMELLQSKEIVNVKNLFGTNMSFLHFAFFSLSSESSFVRQQSYKIISKLFSLLENHVNMFSSKFCEIINLKDQTWIFTLINALEKIDIKSTCTICVSNIAICVWEHLCGDRA